MRKLKRTHGMIFAVVAASLSLGCLGFATYAIETNALDKSLAIQNTTERAVCYVNNSEGTTTGKYTTIEKGLANASSGDTVYVYPGLTDDNGDLYKINITEDCEIKSGVTLSLPYEGTTTLTRSKIASGFADSTEDGVKTNRATHVTIAEGKTITNNGSLIVGGELGIGSSNQRPTGHTAGKYTEITLSDNSQIINNGTMKIYGYIKETESNNNSKITNSSSSSVTMPLVIYDYRGGTYCSNCYTNDIFPFNSFDMPNCQVLEAFAAGSKLSAIMMLYALSSIWDSDCLILGADDSSLFVLSSGTLSLKYHSNDCLYTTNDANSKTKASITIDNMNYTEVVTEGEIKLNKIQTKVVGDTFDTSKFFCPIPQKFRINCKSGTLTIANKMKFLSGSRLSVSEGATLNIGAETVFYQGYIPNITIGEKDIYPDLGASKLTISGNLNISAGGFGGIIEVDGKNAKLTTAEGISDFIVTQEQLTYDMWTPEWHYEYGKTYFGSDAKPSDPVVISAPGFGEFASSGDYWIADLPAPAEAITALKIMTTSRSKTSDSGKTMSHTLFAYYEPSYVKVTDVSFLWTCDPTDGTFSSTTSDRPTFTTPANSDTSNDKTYTVTCVVSFKAADGTTQSISATCEEQFVAAHKQESSGGCLLPEAKILMSDGTWKDAGSIKRGDTVMTFDHEIGKFASKPIIVNEHANESASYYDVLTLKFDNGTSTKLINMHGYFDLDLNKYVYISSENYAEFIGHRFAVANYVGLISETKLLSGQTSKQFTKIVSPVSANNLNVVADGMLTISSGITGLFNIFDYDSKTLAYAEAKMQSDISKYGLLSYKEFEHYFPKQIYDMLPCKYLGVSIGKGLVTWEKIEKYIAKWKDQLIQNIR